MTLHVRPACDADARQMAELLNEIITAGGTTALTDAVSPEDLQEKMAELAEQSAWHVATDESGDLLGFQWVRPYSDLPPEACDIATFARKGKTGLGIGSALFEATRKAAEALGYEWINANIRSDNFGGLAYYQSRGFRDWGSIDGYRLSNGQIVDKTLKRYDLKD